MAASSPGMVGILERPMETSGLPQANNQQDAGEKVEDVERLIHCTNIFDFITGQTAEKVK